MRFGSIGRMTRHRMFSKTEDGIFLRQGNHHDMPIFLADLNFLGVSEHPSGHLNAPLCYFSFHGEPVIV